MSILYCGDTDLTGAASYLAGLMTLWGWEYDYVPSHVPLSREHIEKPRSLYIFSDYPALQVADELQRTIIEHVQNGAGLLMIGGWESFHGAGGDWDITDISRILPVKISQTDDRLNFDQPCLLTSNGFCNGEETHPALFPGWWIQRPTYIGGLNRVEAKNRENILLVALAYNVTMPVGGPDFVFTPVAKFPALVVGEYGQGRTAAFMSDVAPHWVGGFIDWGLPEIGRVAAQAPGAPAIEVGNWYAQFWKQLLTWTGRLG